MTLPVAIHDSIWARARLMLRARLGAEAFDIWLRALNCERADSDVVRLTVPNRHVQRWIEAHYTDLIEQCWRDAGGDAVYVEIALRPRLADLGHFSPDEPLRASVIVVAAPPPSCEPAVPSTISLHQAFGNIVVTYRLQEFRSRFMADGVVSIGEIQRVVCRAYNVSRLDVISARRTAAVVRPRQIAMHLARRLTTFSLPAIGRHFGNRDHTTVLHADLKIAGLVKTDPEIAALVNGLIGQLKPEGANT